MTNTVSANKKLKDLRGKWNKLGERARKLGERRNLLGHTFLSWSDGKVLREIGRPWSQRIEVTETEDNTLITEISTLTGEIALFTTELGSLLPFADDDQILTIA